MFDHSKRLYHISVEDAINRSGADPGFQVGGGGASGGRRENVWGISCEK